MSQQSNSRSLSKVALLSLIGLLLAGCSMSGASKPIEPYVALVSDGILGKTWSYTDSSGRDYAMAHVTNQEASSASRAPRRMTQSSSLSGIRGGTRSRLQP